MRQYHGRFFMRKQIWRCGPFIEAELYPVFQKPGVRRAKSKPTSAIQQELNRRNAERKLTRTVHTNFTAGDYALSLTFRERQETDQALEKLRKYLRKLRKEYRDAGTELKYIYIIERGKSGRVDIHLILNAGIGRDRLEELWTHGYANAKRLRFTEKGVEALTKYMTKQGRRTQERLTYRRWSGSRNLVQPVAEVVDSGSVAEAEGLASEIERRDAQETARRMFPGFELTEATAVHNGANHGLYVTLELCRRELWHERPHALYAVVDWEEAEAG